MSDAQNSAPRNGISRNVRVAIRALVGLSSVASAVVLAVEVLYLNAGLSWIGQSAIALLVLGILTIVCLRQFSPQLAAMGLSAHVTCTVVLIAGLIITERRTHSRDQLLLEEFAARAYDALPIRNEYIPPDHTGHPEAVGIWKRSDVYGIAYVPNSRGIHRRHEFTVTYTIDEHGRRITPDPARPKGSILFLGGSFTFGASVEDDQNYPYLVAKYFCPDWKVINRGVSSYGTGQAYLALQEQLASRDDLKYVVYGWIGLHFRRNYLRESRLENLKRFTGDGERPVGSPYFEIDLGDPVLKGLAFTGDGIPDRNPALRTREYEIAKSLILEMDAICFRADVPFVVLVLNTKLGNHTEASDKLMEELAGEGVEILDLRHNNHDALFYEWDQHPMAPWHRLTAAAVGDYLQSKLLEPRP